MSRPNKAEIGTRTYYKRQTQSRRSNGPSQARAAYARKVLREILDALPARSSAELMAAAASPQSTQNP